MAGTMGPVVEQRDALIARVVVNGENLMQLDFVPLERNG